MSNVVHISFEFIPAGRSEIFTNFLNDFMDCELEWMRAFQLSILLGFEFNKALGTIHKLRRPERGKGISQFSYATT